MNGKSFYVCYNYDNSFNRGAAAAVCRQKGFVDAEDVGTPHMIEYAPYKLLDLTKLHDCMFSKLRDVTSIEAEEAFASSLFYQVQG